MVALTTITFEQPGLPHTHPGPQLLVTLAGDCRLVRSEQAVDLTPGIFAAVPVWQRHHIEPKGADPVLRVLDIRLTEAAGGLWDWAQHAAELGPAALPTQHVDRHVDQLRTAIAGLAPTEVNLAGVYALVWSLLSAASWEPQSDEQARSLPLVQQGRLAVIDAYIREHLHRPELGVTELARGAGLSVSHVHRLFAERLSITPGRYVAELRFERARQMLRESNEPIKRVSHACGFRSPDHFSRWFGQRQGVPPTRYRKAAHGQP